MGERKRATWIGFLILLIMFIHVDMTYGFFKSEAGSYRLGKSIIVKADEIIPEGLFAAGGNVEIFGEVQGALKAFGANVVIPGTVDGNLIFLGSNVVLSGKYQQPVRGGAANLVLSGIFERNVEVIAAKVTIAPTAVIRGDLIYSSPVIEQQLGAQIMGKLTRKGFRVREREVEELKEKWIKRVGTILFSIGVLYWVMSFVSIIIIGLLIHSFLPQQTEAIIHSIPKFPWKNLGIGFVFLVVVPVGAILSMVTLVGIPTGIIAGLLYGMLLYVSRIFMGVWIGRKMLGFLKKSLATAFFWPLLVGIILITLISLIPLVGWFFRLVILLISLGAMWTVIWKLIQEGRGRTTRITLDAV